MYQKIRIFAQRIRLGKPWKYKAPLILTFPYLLLCLSQVSGGAALLMYFMAVVTTIGFAGFGYVSNDLADTEADAVAGKANPVQVYGKAKMKVALLGFLIIALLPWLVLPLDHISVILIATEIVLFVIYAFPPFRLKYRGFSGVLCDALYAYVVPAMLASWTFYLVGGRSFEAMPVFLVSAGVWLLLTGIRGIVYHQIKDRHNDRMAGYRTFVIRIGEKAAFQLLRLVIVPLEILAFSVFLYLLGTWLTEWGAISWIMIVLALSHVFAGSVDPEEGSLKHLTNRLLDDTYVSLLPLAVLTWMIRFAGFGVAGWIILALHAALFTGPVGASFRPLAHRIFRTWPVRKFRELEGWKMGLAHAVLVGIVLLVYVFVLRAIIHSYLQ